MSKKRIFFSVIFVVFLLLPLSGVPAQREFLFSGYMDWKFDYTQGKVATFDAYHFNPIFSTSFGDNLLAEAEIEYEHGGDEIMVEYMKINWILNDYVTLVGGKFLLPFGAFNDRLHPTWISKVPGRPLADDKVVPTGWSDTGIMATGAYGLAKNARVNYSLYLVNGFKDELEEDADGNITQDDNIRELRNETDPRDTASSNKSFGGRLGLVPFAGAELGISGFRGKYGDDFDIGLYGVDAEWHLEDYLELRGEFNYAVQDFENDTLKKAGYYAQAALKLGLLEVDLLNPVEVALRYGGQNFPTGTDDISQTSVALNYYIDTSTSIKGVYHINAESEGDKDNNTVALLFAMGF